MAARKKPMPRYHFKVADLEELARTCQHFVKTGIDRIQREEYKDAAKSLDMASGILQVVAERLKSRAHRTKGEK